MAPGHEVSDPDRLDSFPGDFRFGFIVVVSGGDQLIDACELFACLVGALLQGCFAGGGFPLLGCLGGERGVDRSVERGVVGALRDGLAEGADGFQFAVVVPQCGVVPQEAVGGFADGGACSVFPPPLVGLPNPREFGSRRGGQPFGAAFLALIWSICSLRQSSSCFNARASAFW